MDVIYEKCCPNKILEGFPEMEMRAGVAQPGNWLPENIDHNLAQLYRPAKESKEVLDSEMAKIVKQAWMRSGALLTVRLKGQDKDVPTLFNYDRVMQKAQDKYKKKHPNSCGMALVLDIVRMSIMCTTEDQVMRVIQLIKKNPRLRLVRIKNLFKLLNLDAPHFRRLMLSIAVLLEDGTEYICEVQLHIKKIFEFKRNNNDVMHKPYEYFRRLLGDEINDVLVSEKEQWMELQKRMEQMGNIVKTPVTLALLVVVLGGAASDNIPPPLPASIFQLYELAVDAVLRSFVERKGDVYTAFKAIAVMNHLKRGRVFSGDDVNSALDSADVSVWHELVTRDPSAIPLIKTLVSSLEIKDQEF